MAFVISGTIGITLGGNSPKGWKWNLTEITPSILGLSPEYWRPGWDSADTGAPMEQYYSYAEFACEGPLPQQLIKYLIAPDDTETSLDGVQVFIVEPTITDIEYLRSKIDLPNLKGNESFAASFTFSHDMIVEKLQIYRDKQTILNEARETIIDPGNHFDPEDTLFVSKVSYCLLTYLKSGKTREEIQTMLNSKPTSIEMRDIGLYVSKEFSDIAWKDEIIAKSAEMAIREIYSEEELQAQKEGYEYACKAKDESRVNDCPYSKQSEPDLESEWKSGFYSYFYPD
jgi:hypothetical protein